MRIAVPMTVACPGCRSRHIHDAQLIDADQGHEYVFTCLECGLARNFLDDQKIRIVLEQIRREHARLEEESRLESLRRSHLFFRS